MPLFMDKVWKKANIRNRYNQVPHLAQDTTWESDKTTIKHHIQDSQEVIPFPAGDHMAAVNRQDSITDTKHKEQKGSTKEVPPWTVSTFLLEGLN